MNGPTDVVIDYDGFGTISFYDTYRTFETDDAMTGSTYAPALLKSEVNQRVGVALDPGEWWAEKQELLRAKEAAEAMIRVKDRFLTLLSHELRTPLAPVFMAVQALMDDPNMSRENSGLLEIIEGNIQIEMRLIEDLLDLTRLLHGKLTLRMATIDAHEVVRKALAVCVADIERKHLDVTLRLEAANAIVDSDPVRLEQVIWNLLTNAAKFTPEGGCIRIRTWNDTRGDLLIEVNDTGIGIDEQALPMIFNAFEQGGGAVTRQFGGLGLGLAISRMLMEMLGGRIHAASEGRGHGATFTIGMNVVPDASTPQGAHPQPKLLLYNVPAK